MADTPPEAERSVERWERTEVTVQGEGHSAGRPVIVHRRPGRHRFLVHRLTAEAPAGQTDSTHEGDPGDWQTHAGRPSEHQQESGSEVVDDTLPVTSVDDDIRVTWTGHWEGVQGETSSSAPDEEDGGGKALGESPTLGTDMGSTVDGDSKDFMAEEAFMIGVDRGDLDKDSRDFRAEEALMIGVDKGDTDVDSRDFRTEEAFMIGVDRDDLDMDSRDFKAEEALMIGVDRGDTDVNSRDFRAEEAFMIGVDRGDLDPTVAAEADDAPGDAADFVGSSVDPGEGLRPLPCSDRWERTLAEDGGERVKIHLDKRWFGAGPKLDSALSSGVGNDNSTELDLNRDVEDAAGVGGGGPVKVVRRVERSFSIDEDGRKSQVTDRLLERRKTIEVDREDLSGLEAIHTSCLDIVIGGDEGREEQNVVSEINVIWGKTVEADLEDESPTPDRLVSPREDSWAGSSLGDTDTGDYWSGDVSTDTVRTSGSFDTYVDTGDSMYTSDSNDSLRLSGPDHLGSPDSTRAPPLHSTPRGPGRLERSEAFHTLWDRHPSPLQSRSISVWETDTGPALTISGEPGSVWSESGQSTVVSRIEMDITGGKTEAQQKDLDSESEERRISRGLFKVSDDVANLGLPSSHSSSVDAESSGLPDTGPGAAGTQCGSVDWREDCKKTGGDLPHAIRQTSDSRHSWVQQPQQLKILDNQTDSSELSSTVVRDDEQEESAVSTKTFEGEEFVPLASKKKKKLKKKKKKQKAELRYAGTGGDDRDDGQGTGDDPQVPGDHWPESGSGTVGDDRDGGQEADDDIEQLYMECDRREVEVRGDEASATLVSEERDTLFEIYETGTISLDVGEIGLKYSDTGDRAAIETEDKSEVAPEDSSNTAPVRPTEGEQVTSASPLPLEHDAEDEETKSTPPLSAQDYLTQLFEASPVDQATLFLHSEGNDVLLNVSKGRRRILKPHRRFTKDPRGMGETEPEGTATASAIVSGSPTSRTEEADGEASLDKERLRLDPTDSVVKICDGGGEDDGTMELGEDEDDDKSEARSRKRLAGGQFKEDGQTGPDDQEDIGGETGDSNNNNRQDAGSSEDMGLGERREVVSYHDLNDFEMGERDTDCDTQVAMPAVQDTDPHRVDDNVPAAGHTLPAEDDTVPAEEITVPAEDDTVPAEDDTVPAKDDTVPAEDDNVPAENDTVPAEDDTAPAKDDNVPAEDDTVLAEDDTVPAEDDTVPAEDDTAPAEDDTIPAEDDTVPAEDDTAPAEDDTIPAEDDTVPAEDNTVPAEDDTIPAEDDTVPAEDDTVPAEDDTVPAEDDTVPAEDDTVPAEDDTVPVEDDTVPAEDDTVPAEDDTVPAEYDTVLETTRAGDDRVLSEGPTVRADDHTQPSLGEGVQPDVLSVIGETERRIPERGDGASPKSSTMVVASSAVEDPREHKIQTPSSPQDPEDNPLLWPKKGKKKKKKKNKKDKQTPGGSAADEESSLREDGRLGLDAGGSEGRGSDNTAVAATSDPVSAGSDSGITRGEAELQVRCAQEEPGQEETVSVGVSGSAVGAQAGQGGHVELLEQPGEVSGDTRGGIDGQDSSQRDQRIDVCEGDSTKSVERCVDRAELFCDSEQTSSKQIHRARISQAATREDRENFVTLDLTARTVDVEAGGSLIPADISVGYGDECDSRSKDTMDQEKIDADSTITDSIDFDDSRIVGDKEIVDIDDTMPDDERIIEADDKETTDIETGEETIREDDGHLLDNMIRDLVSDVDIVSVRDIRIYIDDDMVQKIDAIPSEGDGEEDNRCNIDTDRDASKDVGGLVSTAGETDGLSTVDKDLRVRVIDIYDSNDILDDDDTSEHVTTRAGGIDTRDSAVPSAQQTHTPPPGSEPDPVKETLAAGAAGHPDDHTGGKKKKKKRKKQKANVESSGGGDPVSGRAKDEVGPKKKDGSLPHPPASDSAYGVDIVTDIPASHSLSMGPGDSVSDVLVGGSNRPEPPEGEEGQSVKSDEDLAVTQWTSGGQSVDRREDYEPILSPATVTRVRLSWCSHEE